MKKNILPILLSFIWISVSEFARNQFLLKSHWESHYYSMGLIFPSEAANGAIWGLWSLCYAVLIFIISKKFSLWETFIISWTMGFVLMWLVIGNLSVLPFSILPFAIPLSLLEAFIASYLCKKWSS